MYIDFNFNSPSSLIFYMRLSIFFEALNTDSSFSSMAMKILDVDFQEKAVLAVLKLGDYRNVSDVKSPGSSPRRLRFNSQHTHWLICIYNYRFRKYDALSGLPGC